MKIFSALMPNSLRRLAGWALFFCLPLAAQSQVEMAINTLQNGDQVTARLVVANFTEIISIQFTVQWNPAELAFDEVGTTNLPGMSSSNVGIQAASTGKLTFSWFDPMTEGVTLANCSAIFELHFQDLSLGNTSFSLSNSPTSIEIFNGNGQEIDLLFHSDGLSCGSLKGSVYNDANENCQPDAGEQGMNQWKVKATGNGPSYFGVTDADGNYDIPLLPGNYAVLVQTPGGNLWQTCPPAANVAVAANGAANVDFGAQGLLDCPWLEVNLGAAFLRRCFSSTYHVNYCNLGTETAQDAYVQVTFDPFLQVLSSTLSWSSVNGNTYIFPVGDLGVNECGSFSVEVLVSCDAALGQAHCSTAEIFPQDDCLPPDPLWDGGSLEVSAACDGDSVLFEVQNIGDDMTAPVQYFIIVDDMVQVSGDDLQLGSSETKKYSFEANGSTWRIEVDQVAHHPGASQPSAFVEGCGVNGNGGFSLGFVNQFPPDDANLNIDRDCQPNIGAFDPNDKRGYPNGYGVAHFIEPGTDLEYMIRFQNTGTDTAFNIAILDTLSPFFDPASVLPGVSSHPYQFEILGENVLRFTFKDILLPDSNVNEPASHGFVKFRVSQRANVPIGTTIFGTAAIYFDFNEPVITNTTLHTVGKNFVLGQNLNLSGKVNTPFGAPVAGVKMNLAGVGEATTDAAGSFEFAGLAQGGSYTLGVASKANDDPAQGVTVLDALKIRDHILAIAPLTRLDDVVAGDMNGTHSLTTFDIVMMRKVILGDDPGFPLEWTFWAGNWSPPVPASNAASVPGSYIYNSLNTSLDLQNFTGVKPGDVVNESEVDSMAVHPIFHFSNGNLQGQTLVVEVKATDFTAMNGFQFGLQWDAAVLEFADVQQGGALEFFNIHSTHSPTPGRLSLMWYNNETVPLTLPNGTTVFILTFNVLGDIGSSTLLSLDESNVPFQAVVGGCKLAAAGIVENELVIQSPTTTPPVESLDFSLKLLPNPVKSGQPFLLEIQAANDGELTVQVFDAAGKLLRSERRQAEAGRSALALSPVQGKGVYLLKVLRQDGVGEVFKLVVFE